MFKKKKIEIRLPPLIFLPSDKTHKMDCSICLNSITKETGKVELSCSHEFHMKCITRWFAGKKDQTCPCCREKSSEDEIIGRKIKKFVNHEEHEEHVHIDNQWARNIECSVCRSHVEFLEGIQWEYVDELRYREKCTLRTLVVITVINILGTWLYLKYF